MKKINEKIKFDSITLAKNYAYEYLCNIML